MKVGEKGPVPALAKGGMEVDSKGIYPHPWEEVQTHHDPIGRESKFLLGVAENDLPSKSVSAEVSAYSPLQ